jgi:hypothetical protein
MTITESQNGWPASPNAREIDIISVPVQLKAGIKTIQVTRAAGAALAEIVRWWDENIEPVTSLGSYNYRPIRGYKATISNLGSGTAVDINAEKHPLGAVGTVPADKIPLIREKASSLGLRWGGDYRNRKDEMHFEINHSPLIYATFARTQRARETARTETLEVVGKGAKVGRRAARALHRRRKAIYVISGITSVLLLSALIILSKRRKRLEQEGK